MDAVRNGSLIEIVGGTLLHQRDGFAHRDRGKQSILKSPAGSAKDGP